MKNIKTGYTIVYANCITRIDFADIVDCLLDGDEISITNKYGHTYTVEFDTFEQRKAFLIKFGEYCNSVSEVRNKKFESI